MTTDPAPTVDLVTRAVIEHRLNTIVTEMGEAMLRTAYSQILNASRDFSIAILDPQARLIAQADHIPIHVGALPWAVRAVEERFAGQIAPGDVILLNDPYHGGSHLPDLTAFVPVFDGDTRVFWGVVRAHMGDIGGATHGAYNPEATEIWQEGLRVPPVRIVEGGKLRDDLLDMLALNTRFPRDFRGDLAAMIGAARFGCGRISALLDEYGLATVQQATEDILDAAETRARAIVAGWPDGIYHGAAFLDDDGTGREDIAIRACVTVAGDALSVDLSASDPQSQRFVNSSHANSQAAVAMAFAYLLDADIARNDGAFRPLKVVLKPGTIVCAEGAVPVALSTSHPSNEIVEAIIRALQTACPERAMGGWGRRFRISLTGENPRNGRRFIWHLFHARPGGGASAMGDGWSCGGEWHAVGGIKFGSIEVTEARFPLLFERHEFRPGSGGEGQFRGGLGTQLDLRIDVPVYAHTAGDGVRHGSAGIAGGQDGMPHDYRLDDGTTETPLATKSFGRAFPAGSRLRILSSGGGGWGDPARRSAQAIERDRRLGLLAQPFRGEGAP
ncbi:hydantoinase B/oxoprolinase family protein [Pararhodobacter sp.]|uniref:hydantoinase B/oxoprolinase family protein n=1 Tax=Pararhodobacter sp. TaxID=2127056 RepID=UPI002FDE8584